MADGTSKPIEEVELGDEVLATDPETGTTERRQVTALIVGEGDKSLVEITVDTDGNAGEQTGTVVATDGHPFWLADQKKWVDAGDVKAGSLLRTSAGTYVQVTAVRPFTQHRRVHNLTVDGIHTYYVAAGAVKALVHNANGKCDIPRDEKGKFKKRDGESGRDGAKDERTVLDQLELDGAQVVRGEVHVKVDGFRPRKYDGAVKIDGKWFGVETKGGASPLTAPQRKFDEWLNTPGNMATSSGKNGDLELVGVFYGWIPRTG
jgi:hypothetical protein